MKKTRTSKPRPRKNGSDELRAEYRFDYRKSRPNRFASRAAAQTVVVLDADLSRRFPTAESVRAALRTMRPRIAK